MKKLKIGKWIISLVALVLVIGPYMADWNETHIFNPEWTPHAKFHSAQTIFSTMMLGALTLWFVWKTKGDELFRVRVGALIASVFFIAQIMSEFAPGTALSDPQFADQVPVVAGIPFNQITLSIICLGLLGTGYYLEKRRHTHEARHPDPAVHA